MGLKDRPETGRLALPRDFKQRSDVRVNFVGLAVIGMKRDVDWIVSRHNVGEFAQRLGATRHVLEREAGQKLATTGRDLDNPVRLGFGESSQRGIETFGRGDIDRR